MAGNENTSFSNEYPWLLCKLHNNTYAINSKSVGSIIRLTDNANIEKSETKMIRGTIGFLNKNVSLVDMRALMNINSIEKEYDEFCTMIDQRIADHKNWVTELEKSVKENRPFGLATDHHQCAFGKWYDQFHAKSNAVAFHMKKIDEPHQSLHAVAHEVLACAKKCDACERKECLKISLEKAKKEFIPEIVSLLDETKQVFKQEYKEMIIIIDEFQEQFGIIVDAVASVEKLVFLNKNSHAGIAFKTNYVQGIAKTKKSDELILLLDTKGLFEALK